MSPDGSGVRRNTSVHAASRLQSSLIGARLVLLATFGALAACGGDSPGAPPAVASVEISAPSSSVIVGRSQVLTAAVKTANGTVLTDRTVTWSSSNPAVGTISTTGVFNAVVPGLTTISASSGGQTGTAALTVLPVPVATIALEPTFTFLAPGWTFAINATLRDAAGSALTGRTIAWTSDNPSVATIDGSGRITGVAIGSTVISATSEGKSVSLSVAVVRAPVSSITVAIAANTLLVGSSATATATLLDELGFAARGATVVWTSSDIRVATVANDGTINAIAPGQVLVSATADGKAGSAILSVFADGTDPVIASVSPAVLVPGTTATINGARFDAAISRNAVTIRGAAATILSASPTQLAVTVPCVNSGNAPVVVSTSGVAGPAFSHPVSTTTRALGVGQSLVLTSSATSTCNELLTSSGTARYLIAVFSAATSQNTLVNFEIAGNTAGGVVAERIVPAARAMVAATAEAPEHNAEDAAHWRMLERDRLQYEQSRARAAALGIRMSLSAQSGPARASLNAAPVPTVGELRDFYFTFSGGCSDTSRPMRTKALYVGTRAVVWEDTANTLQSSADPAYAAFYQRLGQIFDQDQYATVRDNFGDPLLRDALTDADGRIHMVFSSRLNGSGAAAYVTSCDQFPRSVNAGSNFGEVFYGQVPVSTGSNLNNTNFPDGWFYFMARTVVHEVKHIASQAARVANNAPTFEQSWLEEGTARHAEEMWVRDYLHRVSWKANTGFGSATTGGIYCDFHPADATCNAADPLRRPSYGMRRQFNEIRDKLLSPWDWSPYGDGTSQSGSVFYQTTWSLVRYAIDRYGSSDASFFKALVNSSTNGVTNLTTVAGTSLDQLIGGWGLALFADDYPGLSTSNADLQFQTWNLRSIYAGLNASPNWTTRFPTAFPITPVQLNFGSFVSQRTGLRGGAHSYYELSGSALATQLIQLRGTGGTTPSTNLRIAIARLQ